MSPAKSNYKILIVDDEQDLADVLGEFLRDEGYDVTVTYGGEEAFRAFQKDKMDLILSDVRMPKGDGITLLEKVRAISKDSPIFILMSGYSDLNKTELLHKGVNNILSKPMGSKEMVKIVEDYFSTTNR